MARFASCVWAPVTPAGPTPRVTAHLGLVLHRRSGSAPAGGSWYCNPIDALFSTFYVPVTGSPKQQIDDDLHAPVLAGGAAQYASAELEGSSPVSESQINGLGLILAEGYRVHGWPLILAERPGDGGLLLHGSAGLTFGANGGCPGDDGAEMASAVLAVATWLVNTGSAVTTETVVPPAVITPTVVQPPTMVQPPAVVQPPTVVQPPIDVQPPSVVQPPIMIRPPIIDLPPPTWVTPVNPGTVATTVTLTSQQLQTSVIAALGSHYSAPGGSAPAEVVWFDHDGDVLFEIGQTVVTLLNGMVLISLTLQSDQTGSGQVTVPLGVGTPKQPVGMAVATELRPRGPSLLVDRWGDAATAAAWRALLDVAQSMAAQEGADANGAAFVPAAMTATTTGFTVTPQARQAMDSVSTP